LPYGATLRWLKTAGDYYSLVRDSKVTKKHNMLSNSPIIQEISVHRKQHAEVAFTTDDPDRILGRLEVNANLTEKKN